MVAFEDGRFVILHLLFCDTLTKNSVLESLSMSILSVIHIFISEIHDESVWRAAFIEIESDGLKLR